MYEDSITHLSENFIRKMLEVQENFLKNRNRRSLINILFYRFDGSLYLIFSKGKFTLSSCRFGLICNNSHVIIRIHRNEYIERVGESMYKMVIGLNKEKIINEKNLEIETIYDKLDSIFSKRGFKLSIENDYRTYSGTGADVDYPNLGIILNGLKKQEWFITNLSVWLLCTNEDSDDPNDFEEEDLVEYFGLKVA